MLQEIAISEVPCVFIKKEFTLNFFNNGCVKLLPPLPAFICKDNFTISPFNNVVPKAALLKVDKSNSKMYFVEVSLTKPVKG